MESQFPGRLMAKGTTVKFKFKAILYYKSQLKARPCLTTGQEWGLHDSISSSREIRHRWPPRAPAVMHAHPLSTRGWRSASSGYLLWLLFQKIWSILSTHMAAYNHL